MTGAFGRYGAPSVPGTVLSPLCAMTIFHPPDGSTKSSHFIDEEAKTHGTVCSRSPVRKSWCWDRVVWALNQSPLLPFRGGQVTDCAEAPKGTKRWVRVTWTWGPLHDTHLSGHPRSGAWLSIT